MTNWPTFVSVALVLLFGCSETPCDPATGNCGTEGDAGPADAGPADAGPPDAGPPDAGPPDAGPVGCPALNGTVIDHSHDITADETWAGDGTVHRWSFGGSIRAGATLTVEGCGVVQVGPTLSMTLRGAPGMPARLVTKGAPSRPVLFTNVPDSGPWGNIANLDANGTVDLAYTVLENGGDLTYHGSVIDLRGGADPSTTTVPVLKVDNVLVYHAAGTSVVLESGAGFTADSKALVVERLGLVVPQIEIGMLPAGTIPTLSTSFYYPILIAAAPGFPGGGHFVSRDLTLKNLGPPYYMAFDRVRVTDPTGAVVPTLTLEPGVIIELDDYLMVGEATPGHPERPGVLKAASVTFFPGSAGVWPGIWLLSAAGSRLDHVLIYAAGSPNGVDSANCKPVNTSDDAALLIGDSASSYIPSPSDFASVTIFNTGLSHAINAMWIAEGFGPDLTGGFTFYDVGGCKQTKNGTPTGCMGMPGCLVP